MPLVTGRQSGALCGWILVDSEWWAPIPSHRKPSKPKYIHPHLRLHRTHSSPLTFPISACPLFAQLDSSLLFLLFSSFPTSLLTPPNLELKNLSTAWALTQSSLLHCDPRERVLSAFSVMRARAPDNSRVARRRDGHRVIPRAHGPHRPHSHAPFAPVRPVSRCRHATRPSRPVRRKTPRCARRGKRR